MKSFLKNYRQSSRKVRLVTDLVRGKSVSRAESQLKFLNKRASKVVNKLLDSAVANAKGNNSANKDDLYIKEIRVDEGPTLKRIRARARGSAFQIRKRTSNIALELGNKTPKTSKPEAKPRSVRDDSAESNKTVVKNEINNLKPKA
jgi:large subunit ribosomal protein L22